MLVEDAAGGVAALPDCNSARMRAATAIRRVTESASWRKCIAGCRKNFVRLPDYSARRSGRNVPLWLQMKVDEDGSAAKLRTMVSSAAAAQSVNGYFSKFSSLVRSAG